MQKHSSMSLQALASMSHNAPRNLPALVKCGPKLCAGLLVQQKADGAQYVIEAWCMSRDTVDGHAIKTGMLLAHIHTLMHANTCDPCEEHGHPSA